MPPKINYDRLNTIKNLQLSIVILSALLILICLIIAVVVFYQKTECKMGRSDGKFRPVCYTNALCNAQNSDGVVNRVTTTINAPASITSEIITYPKFDGTGVSTVNVNYDTALPSGSDSLFNISDLGICATTNTVYLYGISPYREVDNANWRNLATATMYKILYDMDSQGIEKVDDPDTYQLIFKTQDISTGVSVTSTENGIFGVSPYLMNSVNGYSDGHVDARDYFFDVAKKNYDDFLNEQNGNGSANNYSCVDPSVIIPCGDRLYNEDLKQWCNGDLNNEKCLNFCSPHWDANLNTKETTTLSNSNDSGSINYQITKLADSTVNNIITDDASNVTYTRGRGGANITGDSTLNGAYLQDLVFCGGISSASGSNNQSYPLSSNVPNANLTTKKINLGF